MTYKSDYSIPEEVLEQICAEGFDALPDLVRIMERQKHLGAGPYERTPERRGRTNGFKPKTMATRVGEITFDIPQVRECDLYPSSMEKGIRSETWGEIYVENAYKLAALTCELRLGKEDPETSDGGQYNARIALALTAICKSDTHGFYGSGIAFGIEFRTKKSGNAVLDIPVLDVDVWKLEDDAFIRLEGTQVIVEIE